MADVPNPLADPTATRIKANETEAVFLPGHGMLGISLRHNGTEVVRRTDELEASASGNRTAGIPFLFPWANRLSDFQYEVEDRGVTLSAHSPLLRYDDNGLPMHGVMWPHLAWNTEAAAADALTASLDWSHPKHLVIFPYPCRLAMTASIAPGALIIETQLRPTSDIGVPVSFGFHPYLGLAGDRAGWRVTLPAMKHLTLDDKKIPTGDTTPFDGLDAPLGTRDFDDGFALLEDTATLSVANDDTSLSVDLLEGYTQTQVFAPHDQNFIAFEPMTAPCNALISGDGLRLVKPGDTFAARFRIRSDA